VQVGPHAQAVPQRQTEGGVGAVFWQPQVQDEPGQVTQVQLFGWADMDDLLVLG
jgi:hypothetical protein